jgi:hypothetical protein
VLDGEGVTGALQLNPTVEEPPLPWPTRGRNTVWPSLPEKMATRGGYELLYGYHRAEHLLVSLPDRCTDALQGLFVAF